MPSPIVFVLCDILFYFRRHVCHVREILLPKVFTLKFNLFQAVSAQNMKEKTLDVQELVIFVMSVLIKYQCSEHFVNYYVAYPVETCLCVTVN